MNEYYEVTIYLKNSKKALCKAIFKDKIKLDRFLDDLNIIDKLVINIGDIYFNKSEFNYLVIKEKYIKR